MSLSSDERIWLFSPVIVAILALLFGTWMAIDVKNWLPRENVSTKRLRWFVRIHALEPWITVPWIFLIGSIPALDVSPDALNTSFILTAPMVMLLIPWLPYPRKAVQYLRLLWFLRIYGVLRWLLTLSMLSDTNTIERIISLSWRGTIFLWVDLLHIFLTYRSYGRPTSLAPGAPEER